ncbi:MAG TPA: Ig-like domain-containing protein [Gaiellaceae bacterium]|jgi:hypothetical protein|nr:Ig-like domain-containing protein [Gaiellaceae bacterium]
MKGVAPAAAFLTATALAVLAVGASAEITATTGEVHEGTAPASVALNQHEHDDDTGTAPRGAHAFDEEQDHVTVAPIVLDVCTTTTSAFITCPTPRGGRIDETSDLRAGSIPTNTCIDSHLVHADPPGAPAGGVVYEGSVSFDRPILGVILLTPSLTASDADPGLAPTVTYEPAPTRGLELDTETDEITINLDANRVVFRFDVRLTIDQIRVITLGDPNTCPGQAKTLTLFPKEASNQVNTQHCVTATVKNATGGPAQGVVVRFDVEGSSEQDQNPADEDASKTTDQNGTAVHCYTGPETVGADTIHAYADNDRDGVEDAGTDPFDDATKTWLPAAANSVTLDPKEDENPVGTQHCLTATVRDLFLNPVPGKTVRFVVTGTTEEEGSDQTDALGTAEFCYSSTTAGFDAIVAYVDNDNDKTRDAGEPFDLASKLWQPGQPASLELDPKAASNDVQSQHCVTATVRDLFQNPVPKVIVRFAVTGVNTKVGSETTDSSGQATFCYTGGTTAGADVITAYADTDKDSTQDPGEPGDVATKTWLPLDPAILTLTPKTDQNIVNTQHCVQAHVTDIFLNPNPDVLVRFTVTGTVTKNETDRTDEGGIAEFCYTSTKAGLDTIVAHADTNENGMRDGIEPVDTAMKLWQPGDPATLVLTPKADENEVETEHCLQAEVKDAFGNPTPNEVVRFDVEGASEQDAQPADEDGSDTTDEFGHATHCYTGPDLPGADTIHAYADNDGDNVEDANEPARDNAEKTWILPPSTPGCEITIHNGGWIYTVTGSKGSFGGNARIEADGAITRGEETYQDHSALTPITFKSSEVLVIVCDEPGKRADIYGRGTIDGLAPPVVYRIRVRDLDEPGSTPGPDTYQIITNLYTSGIEDNPLQGGNVQIQRFS